MINLKINYNNKLFFKSVIFHFQYLYDIDISRYCKKLD